MNYKNYDIKTLLAEVSNDDPRAFQEFFNRYYSRLVDFALLFVKGQVNAEDIVSEVLIKILKSRNKLKKIDRIEGYLFLSVKNQSLNFIQKSARRLKCCSINDREEVNYTDYVNPERKFLEGELRELINSSVANLPPRRRMIYQMIKDDGLKYREVAELLNISVNTVENHLDLAVKSLRTTIESYIEETRRRPKPHKATLKRIYTYFGPFLLAGVI